MRRLLALVPVPALLLAGCASGPAEYADVAQLHQAAVAAGLDCEDWRVLEDGMGLCGDEVTGMDVAMQIHADTSGQGEFVELFQGLSAVLGGIRQGVEGATGVDTDMPSWDLLLGPNWTIATTQPGTIDRVRAELGGSLVTE